MAVSQRLDLRQTQSLVMTPQLQQAIKLLQLSNLELAAYVEQELERNPLLELDDDNAPEGAGGAQTDRGAEPYPADEAPGESGGRTHDTAELTGAETLPGEAEAPLDADLGELYDNSPSDDWTAGPGGALGPGARSAFDEADQTAIEQRLSEAPTLRQHLLDQLYLDLRDPADRVIGLHLIEMLDDSGYLAGDPDQLAGLLGCPPERVEATLRAVQRFDPTGIFARSLRECLALQLADRDRLDPAMEAMLDNLPLIAKRDYAALRKVCGVDDEDLADMIAEIRALNPKPAQAFDAEVAEPIVPDILMRPDGKNGWTIELNSETLPRVLVNARYHAQISTRARSKAD